MRLFWTIVFCILFLRLLQAQELKTENIVIVALDGYRWQEVFHGADASLLKKKKNVSDDKAAHQYLASSEAQRRKELMPFLWTVVANEGQIYGNRDFGNKVNCSNFQLFSYPGYNEMLVGFTDQRIHSNRKKNNPNKTVLEFLNQQKQYNGKVAAFSTWDAFPFILNEQRSGIYVNAATDVAIGQITPQERWLNENRGKVINPANGTRLDEYTYLYAKEFVKREKPKVLFLSFNETDEHGHGGRYDQYLRAATKADQLISDLWTYMQHQPEYKGKTTLIITTDHGRGNGKNNWKRHSLFARGSRQIWFAVIGPDTPALGEVKKRNKYYQTQLAKTISTLAGHEYHAPRPVANSVQSVVKRSPKAKS
jgi:hypothetical protein